MALSPRSPQVALFLAGLAGAALSGCSQGWYPEGRYVSDDKFRYDSTALQPTTVVLLDTRTNATLYTWEIPVDKELVIHFHPGRGDNTRIAPDMCQWDIWDINTTNGSPSYKFACPPADARRVDYFIRQPELPMDMRPNDAVPVMPPSQRPDRAPDYKEM
jgi:hypothetical protein